MHTFTHTRPSLPPMGNEHIHTHSLSLRAVWDRDRMGLRRTGSRQTWRRSGLVIFNLVCRRISDAFVLFGGCAPTMAWVEPCCSIRRQRRNVNFLCEEILSNPFGLLANQTRPRPAIQRRCAVEPTPEGKSTVLFCPVLSCPVPLILIIPSKDSVVHKNPIACTRGMKLPCSLPSPPSQKTSDGEPHWWCSRWS